MSVLKWKVNSSSNFALFFIAMTHNSSVNFKVIPFLLWTKGSRQSSNFDTFKCSGKNLPNFSCHFSNHKSVFLQNLQKSSVSWKITSLYFCSSNIIYFGHKETIKLNFFECSGQKFLMLIKKRQVSSYSIFVSFFIVMTNNSSVNFKLIHFLRWTKGSHESSKFDNFKSPGENLPNSSCHFPNDKSFFLQILYHSSMLWKVTPLYFFLSQKIYNLLKRRPLKWKFLRLSSAQVKVRQIPYVSFETTSRFLSRYCIPLQFQER